MGLERAAAAWSVVNEEERSERTNGKTLPSGFSSHLVLSSLDLIYTLWVNGLELEMYICEDGKTAGKCTSPLLVGILGCHLLGRRQYFFFLTFLPKMHWSADRCDPKCIVKAGALSFWITLILHFESQHGGQGLNTLPGEGDLASHGGWVACTPQEDKQRKQRDQEHKLANTWHGMNFKKHVLFLKSWQQFLQTLKPLRGLLPFPASLFLVFIYLFTGEHGSLARSCQMNKLLFGEASWLRYLIWSSISFEP